MIWTHQQILLTLIDNRQLSRSVNKLQIEIKTYYLEKKRVKVTTIPINYF